MDAQGILNSVSAIKNSDRDKYLLDKSRGTITSTLIGGALGFLVAYNRKWSLIMGTIIGGALAGIISNYVVNKDEKS